MVLKELMHKKDDSPFVMLGEPDIDVKQHNEDKWVVQIKGHDTFNSETSMVNIGRADNIDCWMRDTNYNGQSFFARRIHLPDKNNDRQIKSLKSKLAKKINSKHWDSMTSLESLPFDTPKSGRIAVRIITEYGKVMTTTHEVQGNE